MESRDLRSRRHDSGGSTSAKMMKFHDCKKRYNSCLKLIISCFGRVILEVSGRKTIDITVDVCKKMIFKCFHDFLKISVFVTGPCQY